MLQSGSTRVRFLRWQQRWEPLPWRVGAFLAFHTGACPPPARVCKHALALLLYLSLSRLNHRLPRGQTHPEIMQGTAEFNHQIADTLLPQADPVFHDATALDTAVDRLNAQAAIVQGLIGQLLCQGEILATWCLRRHEDLDLGEGERQEARSCNNRLPAGKGYGVASAIRLSWTRPPKVRSSALLVMRPSALCRQQDPLP
jgi:hypothetical protein